MGIHSAVPNAKLELNIVFSRILEGASFLAIFCLQMYFFPSIDLDTSGSFSKYLLNAFHGPAYCISCLNQHYEMLATF